MYTLRTVGKGSAADETFCSAMNLTPLPKKFEKNNYQIGSFVEYVAQEICQEAAEETMKENDCQSGVSNPQGPTIALDGRTHIT